MMKITGNTNYRATQLPQISHVQFGKRVLVSKTSVGEIIHASKPKPVALHNIDTEGLLNLVVGASCGAAAIFSDFHPVLTSIVAGLSLDQLGKALFKNITVEVPDKPLPGPFIKQPSSETTPKSLPPTEEV